MNINVILMGGDSQYESDVVVGPLTIKCIKEFHVNKVFIGVDGFNKEVGFTCNSLMRAEVAKVMTEKAEKTIVVTDSSKFGQLGVACLLKPTEVDMVITDKYIPEKTLSILKRYDIEVHIV